MRDGIKNQKAMHKLQGKHRNVDARQGQEWERLLRRDKLSDEPQRKGKPHQEDEVVCQPITIIKKKPNNHNYH